MHFMTLFDSAISLFLSHPGWGMVVLMTPWLPILIISGKMKSERWEKRLSRLSMVLVTSGIFLVFFFLALINPLLIGAGHVISVDHLCPNAQMAFAIDTLRIPDPDGESSETFRLHGFSLDRHEPTFRRLYRTPITLVGSRAETIWIQRGTKRWEGIAAASGAVRFVVDAKTAEQKRPELAIGVESISFDANRFLVTVLAKDGQTWTYEPETFAQKEEKRAGPPDDWRTCTDTTPEGDLRLTSEPRATLVRSNGRAVLADHPFLHGTILAIDPTHTLALIRSYTTTDEDRVILTAVRIGGTPALLWEKREEDIADQSIVERAHPLLSHAFFQNDTAIIFIGNSVVGIDSTSGATLWRTRW